MLIYNNFKKIMNDIINRINQRYNNIDIIHEIEQMHNSYRTKIEELNQKQSEIDEEFAYCINNINNIKTANPSNYMNNSSLHNNIADAKELNEEYQKICKETIKLSKTYIEYLYRIADTVGITNNEFMIDLKRNIYYRKKGMDNHNQEIFRATDIGLLDRNETGIRREIESIKVLNKNIIELDVKNMRKNLDTIINSSDKALIENFKKCFCKRRKRIPIEYIARPTGSVVERLRLERQNRQANRENNGVEH